MQAIGIWVNRLEETLIAYILAAMTAITFINVVLRHWFNSGILWGLEATVFLFAWLVLLGASYCVKVNAYLGVDTFVAMAPPSPRRAITLLAVLACLAFSVPMLIGSWEFWWVFAGKLSYLEVNDIPMPGVLQVFVDLMNGGTYDKMPRFIPYFVLPLSMTLLCFRFLQAGWRVLIGAQDLIIVSHEAEDAVAEAGRTMRDGAGR